MYNRDWFSSRLANLISFPVHSGKCQTKREGGDTLMEEEGEMGGAVLLQSNLSYGSLLMTNVVAPLQPLSATALCVLAALCTVTLLCPAVSWFRQQKRKLSFVAQFLGFL